MKILKKGKNNKEETLSPIILCMRSYNLDIELKHFKNGKKYIIYINQFVSISLID